MSLQKVSENAFWVVTTDRARRNSRIPDNTEDDWLNEAIQSAHDYFEGYLGCCIATTEFQLTLDQFPRNRASIELPVWPISEVTRIAYADATGVETEIPINKVVQPKGNERYVLRLKDHESFPTARFTPDAVTIEFKAGWTEASKVPPKMKRAALMLTSHWYENRETVLIGTISKEIEHGTEVLLEQLRPDDDMIGGGDE